MTRQERWNKAHPEAIRAISRRHRDRNRLTLQKKGRGRWRRGWGPGEHERAEAALPAVTECACCGASSVGRQASAWIADHDHETGKFRAHICHPCNIVIGFVEKRGFQPNEQICAYLTAYGQPRNTQWALVCEYQRVVFCRFPLSDPQGRGFLFYEIQGKDLYISDIFTAPECRRQGIARELFQRAVLKARENHCNRILGTVDATRAGWRESIAAQEAVGFILTATNDQGQALLVYTLPPKELA